MEYLSAVGSALINVIHKLHYTLVLFVMYMDAGDMSRNISERPTRYTRCWLIRGRVFRIRSVSDHLPDQ